MKKNISPYAVSTFASVDTTRGLGVSRVDVVVVVVVVVIIIIATFFRHSQF